MKFLDLEHPGEEYTNLGVDIVKKHMDHIVKLADINTLAIDSDYDGTSIPNCLRACAKLPFFWEYLLENDYSEQDINKISHKNLIRVFKTTW